VVIQTDVTGDCPVEYSVNAKGWGLKKIRKVKDMLGCRDRDGHNSAFQAMPYEIDSVSANTLSFQTFIP
jgi:hypothetical protein